QRLLRQQQAAAAARSAATPTPPQNALAAQQQSQALLLQLTQQFQQQKQALLTTQHNELQRLRQTQLLQQNQLANLQSTQDMPQETRRLQLAQLQQQHLLAQNALSADHKAKQQELLRRHQQILQQQKLQIAAATTAATTAVAAPKPTPTPTPSQPVPTQVTAAQSQTAHAAQEKARALSRQNSLDIASSVKAPEPTTLSYSEKLKQLKAKYWDDLEVVNREFTRMAAQKPTGTSAQVAGQQERIKNFLQNLKRIMNLLAQDPTKVTSNNLDVLDKVEQHIERQVMPTLQRLKADKAKKEETVKTEAPKAPVAPTPTAAELQQQRALALQQAQALQLAKERAAAEAKAKKAEQDRLAALQAAAAKAEQERKAKEEAKAKELNDVLKLPPRNVVLTNAQRQALQNQSMQLKLKQQEYINQQSRAKSPASQAKLAQQALLLGQHIAAIAEQLAQSKNAKDKKDDFVSIVPTPAPTMSATDTFLQAIATYAKDKPDVLARAAPAFFELSLSVGATVSTTYV
ncbi:unnamed protein product, partial [Aphanomyces euteiches]